MRSGSPLDRARAELVSHNYAAAAELARQAADDDPDNPAAHFELARAEALLGNRGTAMSELEAAIDRGLADAPAALTNPAFDALRSDARFIQLEERASPGSAPRPAASRRSREQDDTSVSITSGPEGDTIRAGDVVIDENF